MVLGDADDDLSGVECTSKMQQTLVRIRKKTFIIITVINLKLGDSRKISDVQCSYIYAKEFQCPIPILMLIAVKSA